MSKNPVSIDQALESLRRNVTPLESEEVTLSDACCRILRQPVFGDRDMPPFDRVMMDGIAIRYKKTTDQWRLQGTQYAGDDPVSLDNHQACVEIMTGSVLPDGADTVVPVEDYTIEDNRVLLNKSAKVKKGQFVHLRGAVSHKGDCLIAPPVVLDGRNLALCASVGLTHLKVARKPGIAFVSTGNELVDSDSTPDGAQIRLTNDRLVGSELHKLGLSLDQKHHLPDDRESILDLLNRLKQEQDLIVFSGGVSKGRADFIATCVWEAGFEVLFHGILQKPGGPLLAAKHPSGTLVLGMPGNPISSLVCTRLYLRSILSILYGWPARVRKVSVSGKTSFPGSKARLLPVKLVEDEKKGTVAKIVDSVTSDNMLGVLNSDGFVRIPVDEQKDASKKRVYDYFDWAL